eukprot:TRINITY_DN3191_c0_g1_i3.p1 TRINITY_DN3191_c0_g1~~TRINITY_DN3191_c0_g1_i3.p1  ORF type:complete len:286 (+),score=48.94 TRINITY_DN3191_c0_g1_i3:335-1192(+)
MLRLFIVNDVQALQISIFFPLLFVGSLYVWGKQSFTLGRNHPLNIKRRIISVVFVCIISTLYLSAWARADTTWATFFEWMGVRIQGLVPALILPLLLTMILFAGPLVMSYYDGELAPEVLTFEAKKGFADLMWWRNYVVGPAAEEWVFRACICPLLLCGGYSLSSIVLLSPLLFGFAHAHHFIESVFLKGVPATQALLETLFQLFYTTVFGIYSSFLFVRTGHVIGPVLAHTFCNLMGFPALGYIPGHPKQNVIAVTLVLGLAAFFYLLYPLTDPTLYGSFFVYI